MKQREYEMEGKL
jgi:hypothetical protein